MGRGAAALHARACLLIEHGGCDCIFGADPVRTFRNSPHHEALAACCGCPLLGDRQLLLPRLLTRSLARILDQEFFEFGEFLHERELGHVIGQRDPLVVFPI